MLWTSFSSDSRLFSSEGNYGYVSECDFHAALIFKWALYIGKLEILQEAGAPLLNSPTMLATAPLGCIQGGLRYVPSIRPQKRSASTNLLGERATRHLIGWHPSSQGLALVQRGRLHICERVEKETLKWRCMPDAENKEPDPGSSSQCCNQGETDREVSEAPESPKEGASNRGAGTKQGFQMIGPTKQTNQAIALASMLVAVGLFASGRLESAGPGLRQLTANAIAYEEALANGRPTVVEFYADWCEVCREMAHDVYGVEEEYRDRINFVMLNVDNSKWEPELDEFGVEGIPHFAFLDRQGNEEGNIVGRLPKKYLLENVMALARGDANLPHSSVVGQFSSTDSKQAPPVVEPRSHSPF